MMNVFIIKTNTRNNNMYILHLNLTAYFFKYFESSMVLNPTNLKNHNYTVVIYVDA